MALFDRNRPRIFAFGLALLIILGFYYLASQPALVEQATSWSHGGASSPQQSSKTTTSHTEAAKPTPPPKPTHATEISAADLIASPLTNDLFTVPKIFHQSWKTHHTQNRQKEWIETCRQMHPDWHWVLWTDDDNLKLVTKYFPWLLKTYNAMSSNIYRADLVRNLYLFLYGGVYADLDTECLRPSEAIFDSYKVKTARGWPIDSASTGGKSGSRTAFVSLMVDDWNWDHSIPNAWMASTPGHPLWILPVLWLMDKFKDDPNAAGTDPEHLTGPAVLLNAVKRHRDELQGDKIDKMLEESHFNDTHAPRFGSPHDVVVLPGHTIFPYNWNQGDLGIRAICSAESDKFDREQCKARLHVDLEGSVAIAYWSHTWG